MAKSRDQRRRDKVAEKRAKKAKGQTDKPAAKPVPDAPRLPVAAALPTREELAGYPGVTPELAEIARMMQSGEYDPAAHIAGIMRRQRELVARRNKEVATFDSLVDRPAEPWLGKDTPFKDVLWLKADTWTEFNLFPDLPTIGHDGVVGEDDFDTHTVRCPGTKFYYANKTLPLSYSLSTAMHRNQKGVAFFDGPVVMPVLFERFVPEEDYGHRVWMGLTPMEMMTQKSGIDMARGRVVVGGLGLGWFLSEVCKKPEVREVVVVDKVPELLEWLRPVLCEKFPDVARKVKEWLPGDAHDYVTWDAKMRGVGTPAWDLDDTMYLLDIWPTFGDADYDARFYHLERVLGRERLWGWGRGATHDGDVPQIKATERLPFPRAYVRTNPCSGCPFSRTGTPEKDGHADPLALIGQAHGPFILPCHQEPNYDDERQGRIYEKAQCAGAATFRSNVGIAGRFPASFHILPADTERVFASPAELLSRYNGISLEEAQKILADRPPNVLLAEELAKREVRFYGSG